MNMPDHTDPPMVPRRGTRTWVESGPEAITNDVDLAILAVRVGMASNLLIAQLNAATRVRRGSEAQRTRNLLMSLVSMAAVTTESIRLASEQMPRLRALAERTSVSPDLFKRLGKLQGGKHPASRLLHLTRNRVGFHWDADAIAGSVRSFAKNSRLVWLEADKKREPVHSVSVNVLAQVLFPAADQPDMVAAGAAVRSGIDEVADAMRIVNEFFAACLHGYFRECGATYRELESARQRGRTLNQRKRRKARRR